MMMPFNKHVGGFAAVLRFNKQIITGGADRACLINDDHPIKNIINKQYLREIVKPASFVISFSNIKLIMFINGLVGWLYDDVRADR